MTKAMAATRPVKEAALATAPLLLVLGRVEVVEVAEGDDPVKVALVPMTELLLPAPDPEEPDPLTPVEEAVPETVVVPPVPVELLVDLEMLAQLRS